MTEYIFVLGLAEASQAQLESAAVRPISVTPPINS
jgi:hypothetical protein